MRVRFRDYIYNVLVVNKIDYYMIITLYVIDTYEDKTKENEIKFTDENELLKCFNELYTLGFTNIEDFNTKYII